MLFLYYEMLVTDNFITKMWLLTTSNTAVCCLHIKIEIWFFKWTSTFLVILSKKSTPSVRRHTNNNNSSKYCVCMHLYTICIHICCVQLQCYDIFRPIKEVYITAIFTITIRRTLLQIALLLLPWTSKPQCYTVCLIYIGRSLHTIKI